MTNKPNYKYFAALQKVAYSYLKLLILTVGELKWKLPT